MPGGGVKPVSSKAWRKIFSVVSEYQNQVQKRMSRLLKTHEISRGGLVASMWFLVLGATRPPLEILYAFLINLQTIGPNKLSRQPQALSRSSFEPNHETHLALQCLKSISESRRPHCNSTKCVSLCGWMSLCRVERSPGELLFVKPLSICLSL